MEHSHDCYSPMEVHKLRVCQVPNTIHGFKVKTEFRVLEHCSYTEYQELGRLSRPFYQEIQSIGILAAMISKPWNFLLSVLDSWSQQRIIDAGYITSKAVMVSL